MDPLCSEWNANNSMDFLKNLTKEQSVVVRARLERSLLIAASPGAGKTHTLLSRLAFLLLSGKLEPGEFVFFTFSRAGIEEARSRLEKHAAIEPLVRSARTTFQQAFQTLHSFGRRLVESTAAPVLERTCQRRTFMNVISQTQKRAILREAIERYRQRLQTNWDRLPSCTQPLFHQLELSALESDDAGAEMAKGAKSSDDRLVKEISVQIAERKARFISPPTLEQVDSAAFQWPLLDFVYALYECWLQHLNCIDFDDMIVMAVRILETQANPPHLFPRGLRLILIDEFQDTSASQLRLVRALAKRYACTVCAAGDDDQCIYEWRQARPQFMTEFTRFFPDAAVMFLRESIRCPVNIACCANALIQHNTRRLCKNIEPLPGYEQLRVRIILGRCVEDEVAYLGQELVRLHTENGVAWKDMAVLCRVAQPLETLRKLLRERDIPYAGAEQSKTVARNPQNEYGIRMPASNLDHAWRETLILASPLVSMITLLVNEYDLHSLDDACKAYAPSMHALTRTCVIDEARKRRNMPLMRVVQYMVENAQEFFEGVPDRNTMPINVSQNAKANFVQASVAPGRLAPGFKRVSEPAPDAYRPKLSQGQWKACRVLLAAYERLLVIARDLGPEIRLERMLEVALELLPASAPQHGWSITNDTRRLLRHLAHHVDEEARTRWEWASGAAALPSPSPSAGPDAAISNNYGTDEEQRCSLQPAADSSSKLLYGALARRRRCTPLARNESGIRSSASQHEKDSWRKPLRQLLLCLQDAWQEGTRAFAHARRKVPLDAVAVSTIHNAKGREWPFVFILRAVQGSCPLLYPEVDLEEERRVFYVGLTRARQQCTILASEPQTGKQQDPQQQPSIFLDELSAPHCERIQWRPVQQQQQQQQQRARKRATPAGHASAKRERIAGASIPSAPKKP
jgi:superfamily I DNA/RNA helicase